MPDYDEARQDAMSESADEYIQQGKDEMLAEVLEILDERIADEVKYTIPQIGVLREVRSHIKNL
jgi:hypothetical protein